MSSTQGKGTVDYKSIFLIKSYKMYSKSKSRNITNLTSEEKWCHSEHD